MSALPPDKDGEAAFARAKDWRSVDLSDQRTFTVEEVRALARAWFIEGYNCAAEGKGA